MNCCRIKLKEWQWKKYFGWNNNLLNDFTYNYNYNPLSFGWSLLAGGGVTPNVRSDPKIGWFWPPSYWPHIRAPSCCASRVTRGRRRGGIKLCPPHFWVTPNSDRLDIWGRSEHLGTGGEIFVESKQRKYTLDEMFLPVNVRQQIE